MFSSEEWRDHLVSHRPSAFPFFSSTWQFWSLYVKVIQATKGKYPFNWGYHIMNAVIGTSFTAEYFLKGSYENTVGALSEWWSGAKDTAEDEFNRKWNAEYVAFIRLKPWYEFSFTRPLGQLWGLSAAPGASSIRRWERRFFLTTELLGKALWGWVIGVGAGSTFGAEDETMRLWVKAPPSQPWKKLEGILEVEPLGGEYYLLKVPRYEPFTTLAPALAAANVTFVEIAGNRNLVGTFLVPASGKLPATAGELISRWPVLTRPDRVREARLIEVRHLAEILSQLRSSGAQLDHLFDY